jgi:hypothetical protein
MHDKVNRRPPCMDIAKYDFFEIKKIITSNIEEKIKLNNKIFGLLNKKETVSHKF